MLKSVVIAGGGTGGHLFPGLAVVEELRSRFPNVRVHFIGTERGIEARILPECGEKLSTLRVTPLKGQRLVKRIQSLGAIPIAILDAIKILRREKPSVVIGVGGYASGPALVAATLLGIPTAILEQNAHLGLTNRILRHWVGRAYLSFETTSQFFSKKKSRVFGNPVRRDFIHAAQKAWIDPEGFEAKANKILILGGSQGAKKLNETLPYALSQLTGISLGQASTHKNSVKGPQFQIIHQTGKAMQSEVEALYKKCGVKAEVVSFIEDVPSVLQSAAVVISRAGATTVAELSVVGRPSVLIPFPFAADDHQTKNAKALEEIGASVCLPQNDLTFETLQEILEPILLDLEQRKKMAESARKLGKLDAAASIVDDLCAWLNIDSVSFVKSNGDNGQKEEDASSLQADLSKNKSAQREFSSSFSEAQNVLIEKQVSKQFSQPFKKHSKIHQKSQSSDFSGSFTTTYWPFVDPVVYGPHSSQRRPKRPLVFRM